MEELNINLEMILNKLNELEPIKNDSYLEIYTNLQRFSERQTIRDKTTLVGLAHMVYGWMPTILTFNKDKEMKASIFEDISKGSLEKEFLIGLKKTINNSIVGVSKLLHFMNSNDYAIWDSRVYYSITGKKAHEYRVNSVDKYVEYMNKIRLLSNEMDYEYVKGELEKKNYYTQNMSKVRMIEIIFFYTGR